MVKTFTKCCGMRVGHRYDKMCEPNNILESGW